MATFTITSGEFLASQAFRWWCRCRVYCHTAGAGGTWSSEILGILSCSGSNLNGSNGTTGATLAAVGCDAATLTTVDTTADQALALQMAWGSTTGAPSLTSRVALYKRIA